MQRPFSIKTKQLRATALDPVSLGILEAGKGPVDGINARRSRGDGQLPTAVVPGIARIFAFSVEDDRVDPLRCRIVAEAEDQRLEPRSSERDLVHVAHPIDLFDQDLEANLLGQLRSEEHTSELQSLMRISYAVFCLT